MIRRPVTELPPRRKMLLHAPLGAVIVLGGLVMTLSDEPAAYSSGRVAVGSISDPAPSVVQAPVETLVQVPAWRQLPSPSLEAYPGLPATLTGLGHPPGDERLGAALRRDSVIAAQTLRTVHGRIRDAGAAASGTAKAPAARVRHSEPAPATSEPDAGAARVIEPPSDPDVDSAVLMSQTADFLARYYRRSRDKVGTYVEFAFEAAQEHGLDPLLLTAIMSIESSLDPSARSHKGAKGLMQVLVAVHKEKFEPYGGTVNAFDPRTSVMVGAHILGDMLERTGTVQGALKHYVGAANLRTDGGYGAKVIRMRDRIWHAATGRKVPRDIELAAATERANLAYLVASGGLKTAAADPAAPGGEVTRLD